MPAKPFEFDADREPWEKQRGETANSFAGFAVFRDLGPQRTIPKAAEAHGKGAAMLSEWSARYRWYERAEAYDLMVDARHREQTMTLRDEILDQHRYAAQLGLRAVIARARGEEPSEMFDAGVEALDPSDLNWGDWARVLETTVRTQRLAIGEPTDFVKGALMLTPPQAQKIVQDMAEIALRFIPKERGAAFFAEIESYFSRGGDEPPLALTAG